jgi:outer membrane immunogenic protein
MKSALFGFVCALAVSPAVAADFPTKASPTPLARPIYDWTGLYVGINAGGGQNHNCWDANGALVFGFSPSISEGCNDATGAVVGGQIGYRTMLSNFVFGIEAQGDWANLKGSNNSNLFSGLGLSQAQQTALGLTLVNTTKTDAIGMFTGQVGYSFGALLWYAKGGVAVTHNEYSGALGIAPPNNRFSASLTDGAKEVKIGGVVGTGLEYMFAPGWSIGAEYNHLFMGSENVGTSLTSLATTPAINIPAPLLAPGMPVRNEKIGGDIDMATVRVNYKF